MNRPHSDRNQGRKKAPASTRIRIPKMYLQWVRAELKRLKQSAEYQAEKQRVNEEE